jgi:hypothetical protein
MKPSHVFALWLLTASLTWTIVVLITLVRFWARSRSSTVPRRVAWSEAPPLAPVGLDCLDRPC